MQYRPPTGSIPDAPGSYQFLDAEGRVLYVGKAKSLRHRLPNYWQDSAKLLPRHGPDGGPGRPRRVGGGGQRGRRAHPGALAHPGPPAPLQRPAEGRQELPLAGGHAQRGVAPPGRGAGPQAQGGALLRPLRPRGRHPGDPRPAGAELPGPHLLGHQVHAPRAAGPALPALRHRALLGPVRRRGRPRGLRRLRRGPHGVPLRRHRAGAGPAGGRDARGGRRAWSSSGRPACATASSRCTRRPRPSRWSRSGPRTSTWSGIAEDELEAAVQVFHVRRGRVVGRRGFVAEKVEDLLGARVHGAGRVAGLRRRRGRGAAPGAACPRSRPTATLLESWLRRCAGGPVDMAVPRRGAKRALQETVTRIGRRGPGPPPAAPGLRPQRPLQGPDRAAGARSALREAPLRIECYDMSHLQGTDYVGSMVVFEDGLAKRSDYRRFKVKSVPGNDDYAAMEEVLTRRLTRARRRRRERAAGRAARPRRFAYRPNLLLRRRRQGPARRGRAGGRALGLDDEIELAALAKQFEEVYRPGLARAGAPAPRLRRPLPPPAGARRGPPLRHHLPPGAPGQADDAQRPRRHPGPGPGPPGPAGQGAGRGQRGAGRLARGAPGPVVAARRRRPSPSTTACARLGPDDGEPSERCRP